MVTVKALRLQLSNLCLQPPRVLSLLSAGSLSPSKTSLQFYFRNEEIQCLGHSCEHPVSRGEDGDPVYRSGWRQKPGKVGPKNEAG